MSLEPHAIEPSPGSGVERLMSPTSRPAGQKGTGQKAAGTKGTASRTESKRTATRAVADTPKSKRRRRRFRAVWRRLVFVGLLCVVAMLGGVFELLNSVEVPKAAASVETSFVCLADVGDGACGSANAVAQFSATENRVPLAYEDVPRVMIQAVVAGEDREFFRHSGVDPAGIARAIYQGVRGTSVSRQGASTITQQYVKTVFLTPEVSLGRKLREAALAIKLEQQLTKEEILERYLNQIYFGRGAYGVEAASQAYFDVPAKQLNLEQAALLAGLIRSPNTSDPSREPEVAKRRRASVLDGMVEIGSITKAQAATANAVPFEGTIVPRVARTNNTRVEPDFSAMGGEYIAEWVRQQLSARLGGGGAAYTKGLRVYLTIDPDKQRAASNAITKTLKEPNDPSSALMSIDPSGRIAAMIGGRDYRNDQVNYALGTEGGGSGRGAGSTFKVFALAAYIQAGFSVKSVYPAPALLILPKANDGVDWEVANYDDEDLGAVPVDEATWRSVNTVYAAMTQKIGPKAIADMATTLGITSKVKTVASTALGTTDVSVKELTTAFATLANRGVKIDPFIIRRIESNKGDVLFDAGEAPRQQVITPELADAVSGVLKGVPTNGTGKGARMKREAVGKTGTTSEYKDAWYAGYTCNLTTVVWMGYPETGFMTNVRGVKVTGGSFPATIWRDYMEQATANDDKCSFPESDPGLTRDNPDLVAGPPTTTTLPPVAPVDPAVPPPGGVPPGPTPDATPPAAVVVASPVAGPPPG